MCNQMSNNLLMHCKIEKNIHERINERNINGKRSSCYRHNI